MGRFGTGKVRYGITLTEILAVIVIIGLLSALAIPKLTTSMGESQLEADCNRLFADLLWAKTQAPNQSSSMNRSGTRIFVVFDTAHKSWTIYRDNGDSTFSSTQDSVIKKDSLSPTSRFGFHASFTLPSLDTVMGAGVAPQTGFGKSTDSLDDCLDGRIYPAPTPTTNTWAYTGTGSVAGKIVVCGGAVGDMSNGSLYITTTRSKKKAYAIVFNSMTAKRASYSLRRYLWNGSAWSKI